MTELAFTGLHAHACPDWDYLVIDETCSEFEYCLCYRDKPTTEAQYQRERDLEHELSDLGKRTATAQRELRNLKYLRAR